MVILNKHKKNIRNNKAEQRYREKNINKIYNIIELFDEK